MAAPYASSFVPSPDGHGFEFGNQEGKKQGLSSKFLLVRNQRLERSSYSSIIRGATARQDFPDHTITLLPSPHRNPTVGIDDDRR